MFSSWSNGVVTAHLTRLSEDMGLPLSLRPCHLQNCVQWVGHCDRHRCHSTWRCLCQRPCAWDWRESGNCTCCSELSCKSSTGFSAAQYVAPQCASDKSPWTWRSCRKPYTSPFRPEIGYPYRMTCHEKASKVGNCDCVSVAASYHLQTNLQQRTDRFGSGSELFNVLIFECALLGAKKLLKKYEEGLKLK